MAFIATHIWLFCLWQLVIEVMEHFILSISLMVIFRTEVLGNAGVATGELTSDVSVFVPEGMRNTGYLFLTQI